MIKSVIDLIKQTALAGCLLLAVPVALNGQVPYEAIYATPGWESVSSLIRTQDKGLAHLGSTTSFGAGGYDLFLLKMDSLENIEWLRTYGGPMDEVASQVKQLPDGGFLVAGVSASFGMGAYDGYILRTDPLGNVLWQRTIGGSQDDVLSRFVILDDTTFVFGGYTKSKGAGGADYLMLKMNASGDTLWTRVFGAAVYDGIVTINHADGGFICSGRTTSTAGLFFDAVLFKTDTAGMVQWFKAFGGPAHDEAMYVAETPGGGFIATGASNSPQGAGQADVFVVRTDSAGNFLWTKLYGGPKIEATYDLLLHPDSGYTVIGYTESFNAGPAAPPHRLPAAGGDSANVFVMRLTAAGDTVWTRAIGGGLFDEGYNIAPWASGGCVISAYSASFSGSDTTDLYLLHIDTLGNSGCHNRTVHPVVSIPVIQDTTFALAVTAGLDMSNSSVGPGTGTLVYMDPCIGMGDDEHPDEAGLTVYPNPSTGLFNISINRGNLAGQASLVVYNRYGRVVHANQKAIKGIMEIDLSGMPPGIYFLCVQIDKTVVCKKIAVIGDQ